MTTVPVYEFSCPSCGENIHLDGGVREQLLEWGCVVCGEPVSERHFSLA